MEEAYIGNTALGIAIIAGLFLIIKKNIDNRIPIKKFNEDNKVINNALALHLDNGLFYLPEKKECINFFVSHDTFIPKWNLTVFNLWYAQNLLLSAEEVDDDTLAFQLYNQYLQKLFNFTEDDFSTNSTGKITTRQKRKIVHSWLHHSSNFVLIILLIAVLLMISKPAIELAIIVLILSSAGLLIPVLKHARVFKANSLLRYEGQATLKTPRNSTPIVQIKEEPRELHVYLSMERHRKMYKGTYQIYYVKYLDKPISMRFTSRVRKRPKKNSQ